MSRHEMRVTCKAALYNPDRSKVLVVEYAPGNYGLPGGHIELGETPDQAMNRELSEELGLRGIMLHHRDFWLHNDGKLILGFVGELDETTSVEIQDEELRGAAWHPVADITSGKLDVNSYNDFIVNNAI